MPGVKLFYVETGIGCGIRAGETLDQIEEEEIKKVGTYNGVQLVREATPKDIAYVRSMGGYIPQV